MNDADDETSLADILGRELARIRADGANGVLETLECGVIRSSDPAHRHRDGWSTLTFAEHAQEFGGSHTGIDLDTSHAQDVVGGQVLAGCVDLITADSIAGLESLVGEGRTFDVILLDSDNDPDRTFGEYLLAVELVRSPGLVIVDDAAYFEGSRGVKGDRVMPYLTGQGRSFRVVKRRDSVHRDFIDVVLIDFPQDPGAPPP